MTKGACPLPGERTIAEQDVDNGNVRLIITWEGDGTSTFPNCDGPVDMVETINTSAVSYYAHLPHKTRGMTVVEIPPGTDTTLTGNQLKQAGLSTYKSLEDLVIDTNPNP